MAGHAKWQNIKHIKDAKDREKSLVCNRYAFLLRSAVREGGADPKLNNKLCTLLEQARKNNVPASVVESALKSSKNSKPPKVGSIEILGPGGCIVVMEYEADNVSTMRHEVKGICKKYGANIMTGEGRWRAVFEKKGIIKALSQKDGQPLDAERALDSAIEAGAEEVQTKEDENEKTYLEFICGADDLHPVKKEIERLYEVEEGYVGYLPINKQQLDEETMTLLDGFLEDLGNMTEVIRIFENAE
ncbi:hypothetical protein JTE90_014929 [Oedothorax gibbosus]|uniref:Translational activator of cytochrome c oxidase 1 n=1 Tax=Oedothorax gibbosus TaxID=931172 RepID=A0AAV6VNQ3_9ARAC|nr:hypothetical protein JTE90_014929 [Oedothorax gibbosus]